MSRQDQAVEANQKAIKLQERGRLKEAIKLYEKAAATDPTWPAPMYNLGLLFKNQHQWKESLKYNQLATARDSKHEEAWWNLGIAATALGRWQLARSAWRNYGIDVPNGEGPIDFPCGFGPIRLDPQGNAEVVWAYRIDPARAEIASIPLPETSHRWKDIVLNDGAPNGYRQYKGKEVPVLDALELLERSRFGTFVADVRMPSKRDYFVKLAELADGLGGSAEDWSTSIRLICKACSEGRAHKLHDTELAPADGVHMVAVAARDRDHATAILRRWESDLEEVQVESLDEALEPG